MASRERYSGNSGFGIRINANRDYRNKQQSSPSGRFYGNQSQARSQSSLNSDSSYDSYDVPSRDRGPSLKEDVCVGEEVKIAVNMAIDRFINDENSKELEFPSSFTATERAYIHRLVQPMGLKSRSKGKKINRTLTIYKTPKSKKLLQGEAKFQLVDNSRHQIQSLLQRFPLTSKERQELQPRAEKAFFSRDMNKTTTGRLTNGVSQIPPCRGDSELNRFRQTLPIFAHGREILNVINNSRVSLISGETGSGKTTQVPQLILDDCYAHGKPCRIFCTQPRRLAALTIAERVAAERGEKIGQTVGYQIRLESKVSPKTLLTFCTNGVLLRTLMGSDNALNTVTHVIVDEVHERDRFSDFLLICLRDLLSKFHHLKVILMSAALNVDLFVSYFNSCPVVSIPGNLFDVQEYFLEDVLKWTKYSNKKMEVYMSNLTKVEKQQQHLQEWCRTRLPGTSSEVKPHIETSEGSSVLSAELGEEKDELEPWLMKEMDDIMGDIWLNGNEESFTQVFHLITSEGVSVDYCHTETTATALMIAAARGFVEVVEQLLNLGANINKRASNGWTALEMAKKFSQEPVVELLEAYIAAGEEGQLEGEAVDECVEMSQEDKDLLAVYQACFDDEKVDVDLITTLVHKIHSTQPEGAILVFLPGYDDIVAIRDQINEDPRFENTRYVMFTLHSAMQSTEQKRVFRSAPPGVRKIILSTNIAETSLTINDVVYVINSGKVKEKTYDALSSVVMLKSYWTSKASVKQRKGRAGRCRPGVCYNMFSSVRFAHMSEYQLPEIVRYPLQELCLHTKLLTSPDVSVADFLSRAPEAPAFLMIKNAVQLLKQMDAFDGMEDLTELGHHLTDLPLDPRLGKMVLYSVVLKCLDPVLTITCALAYKDPFLLPTLPSHKRAANAARKKFSAGTFSDHMTYLRAFQAWQKARSDGWERSFCEKHFLSSASFEMIVGMRTQLLGQLRASGFVRARGGGDIRDLNTNSENWPVVKAALCAGSYPNLLRVDRARSCLVTQKKDKVHIHNSSVICSTSSYLSSKSLAKAVRALPSDWLIYEEMGQRLNSGFVRCCTMISPITALMFGGPAKLPTDTIREAENHTQGVGSEIGDEDSDSESEDRLDGNKSTLKLDDWISFKVDAETMNLALHLRQKWHALFFRRMRTPSKPWSQIDEGVLRTVISVLSSEEQAIGLQQPTGIGQRPRPMSVESFQQSGGRGSYEYDEYNSYQDNRGNNRPRKSPGTTPKRTTSFNAFKSPGDRSGSDNKAGGNNSGCNSPRGSGASTPCASPGSLSPSVWVEKDLGDCRYFVLKCRNSRDLETCVATGMLSVTAAVEKRLSKAQEAGHYVILIFSVQGSGHFQGYARLLSTGEPVIGHDGKLNNKYVGVKLEWIQRFDIPFQDTQRFRNKYFENKRIQESRDGQEIEPRVGKALVSLWHQRHPGSGDGPTQWAGTRSRNSSTSQSADIRESYPVTSATYSCNNPDLPSMEGLSMTHTDIPSTKAPVSILQRDSSNKPVEQSTNTTAPGSYPVHNARVFQSTQYKYHPQQNEHT